MINSNEIKRIGTLCMLKDKHKLARKNFIQAIKINPASRIYINLLLSFSPWLYKRILFIKKKNEK